MVAMITADCVLSLDGQLEEGEMPGGGEDGEEMFKTVRACAHTCLRSTCTHIVKLPFARRPNDGPRYNSLASLTSPTSPTSPLYPREY